MNKQMTQRAFFLLSSFTLLLIFCLIKLGWLQVGTRMVWGKEKRSLSLRAVRQHFTTFVADEGRGQFLDRKGQKLTGETVYRLVAFPSHESFKNTGPKMAALAQILHTSSHSVSTWLKGLRTPTVWHDPATHKPVDLTCEQQKELKLLSRQLEHISPLPYNKRYLSAFPALHALGFISQHPEFITKLYREQIRTSKMKKNRQIGGSGLEKSLDRYLQSNEQIKIKRIMDGAMKPLKGLGFRVSNKKNNYYPLQIVTTLDKQIQQRVEQILNQYRIKKGAVVILDAKNADILAMVSRPVFNPESIGEPGSDERNHALSAFPPGSIFKTVTLAAALESGATQRNEFFYCDGRYHKYELKCWKRKGHKKLTLFDAYIHSCNIVFAGLAEQMDPAWIHFTAKRLGLGEQIGWHTDHFFDGKPLRLLEEEQAGTIFRSKKLGEDPGVRALSGIGQRDVRITPLQAANMVVTVLNDGERFSPRLVKELRYANSNKMLELEVKRLQSKVGYLSPPTANIIRQAMQQVSTRGTAAQALAKIEEQLAGKTGTAELSGRLKAYNDHWFIGFGPVRKPRYAVAVLLEEEPKGVSNRAPLVFRSIMQSLRKQEQAEKVS